MTVLRSVLLVCAFGFLSSLLRADDFPEIYNTTPPTAQPISPADAVATTKLPDGFQIKLFAAEPDVQNPIAISIDERGRLWVGENYCYGDRKEKLNMRMRDRILIFTDEDGDGKMDSRKVFTDQVQMLSSVAQGHGGLWAICCPQLIFIPDRDGDDIPDGSPEVMLDGFDPSIYMYHTFANGLKWGPDGWLYGRCGASSAGEIGVPGTPADKRLPLRGGIWRFHPERKVLEIVSSGTTNPWGHDWNPQGDLFFINTVNGHLWHGITGAHFEPIRNLEANAHLYELIDQHADHYHFDSSKPAAAPTKDDPANEMGGGHAHIGAMIYQGNQWPEKYRGHIFTLNLHGRRINDDRLDQEGSGYVGRHEPDTVTFGDPWFRGIDLATGPDGGVFVIDWSDSGECHERDGIHRTSGRIYKITYGNPAPQPAPNLAKLSTSELVRLQRHDNDWYARESRRLLHNRSQVGESLASAHNDLEGMIKNESATVLRLRALWTLWQTGGVNESRLQALLADSDDNVRVWAIRLLVDHWPLDECTGVRPTDQETPPSAELLNTFVKMARDDRSAMVRLALASTLQRLPVALRPQLAAPLLAHAEDAGDHNLPLMIWYGLLPITDHQPAELVALAKVCELPTTRRLIARRLAEDIEKSPGPLNELLTFAATKPLAYQSDVVVGMGEAFSGWRKAPQPAAWAQFQEHLTQNKELQDNVRDLSVLFGDGRALDGVKDLIYDKKADILARKRALQTLIDARDPELRAICEEQLKTEYLNLVAARGLSLFDDPRIGRRIANSFNNFAFADRSEIIGLLVSRPEWAEFLLNSIERGRIPRSELSAFQARQIRAFEKPELTAQLGRTWGELRDSPAEKQQLADRLRKELSPEILDDADPHRGREIFAKTCAVCHTLYGQGGRRGPDLTGAQRQNLNYLLENIVDPSAMVPPEFRVSNLELGDGRVLTGAISARTEKTLTLNTQTETMKLEMSDVAAIKESSQSLMPDGLLETLAPAQVKDLFAYLMTRQQVSLPEATGE